MYALPCEEILLPHPRLRDTSSLYLYPRRGRHHPRRCVVPALPTLTLLSRSSPFGHDSMTTRTNATNPYQTPHPRACEGQAFNFATAAAEDTASPTVHPPVSHSSSDYYLIHHDYSRLVNTSSFNNSSNCSSQLALLTRSPPSASAVRVDRMRGGRSRRARMNNNNSSSTSTGVGAGGTSSSAAPASLSGGRFSLPNLCLRPDSAASSSFDVSQPPPAPPLPLPTDEPSCHPVRCVYVGGGGEVFKAPKIIIIESIGRGAF